MGKSITWTLLYYKSFLEDVEKMLSFLRKYERWAIKSDLRSIVKNNKNRDSILKFMEDVHLIEVRPTGRTSRYNITREGIDYLQSENRSKYLHKLLYKNIIINRKRDCLGGVGDYHAGLSSPRLRFNPRPRRPHRGPQKT